MDIPKIKIKDVIKKLSFLKNYLSLLVPIAITVVAILLFLPTQLMSSKLKKQIYQESISTSQKIETLKVDAVPSDQWQIERDYQQSYQQDANTISNLARQTSQRELLSYKIFPTPKDKSTLIFTDFGSQFRSGLEVLLANSRAGECPTDVELDKTLRGSSSGNSDAGLKTFSSLQGEVEKTIAEILCLSRAESAVFYARPADISGYEFWADYEYAGVDNSVKDCWYYQIAYWVTEDIIKAISAMNSGSKSILSSPVKRLVKAGFKRITTDKKFETTDNDDDRLVYVLSPKEGLAEPFTGRFCDDDLDVVHFAVNIVVRTESVLPFIRELCNSKQHKFRGFFNDQPEQVFKHNQITVLESTVKPVDRQGRAHKLYRYGEDAVVELTLVCEYIFNKHGYDTIKPEIIKRSLSKEIMINE
jgi:hypothetical protein